ncbi:MAG: neutral/alkaline non-lysosomal ceramidase N-terminal domain-containing protein, partial [Phycisphaerae bacterium]|nr:neutral/alkaline non-lysosomal ceramidase N-terminal domain-containing protein [Phycisphaerae bacterium]
MNDLIAGAASADISPKDSQFLYGYPHVERYGTGVHDPLLSSALYLSDSRVAAMFIADDIIFITEAIARRVRRRIEEATSIPAGNIMVTATHTHSGPMTVDCLSCEADPVVPKT